MRRVRVSCDSFSSGVTAAPLNDRGARPLLLGNNEHIRRVLSIVHQVADTNATVLICGESGTGKEVVAHLLHDDSRRAAAPFVAVNCGAIAEGLLESELFGHLKGAFTGASQRQIGKIEAAGAGTLFLDEIGELTPALQVKLLRFLQSGEYAPVGSSRVLSSTARTIAATNRDLRQLVAAGLFRHDLFYRLNVVRLDLPPLRLRKDDLPALIDHFLRTAALAYDRPLPRLTPAASALLLRYSYPGNVRELENLTRAAVLLAHGPVIDESELPLEIHGAVGDAAVEALGNFHEAKSRLIAEFERQYLTRLVADQNWVISAAARRSGLSERNLHAKLKQYGLKRPRSA